MDVGLLLLEEGDNERAFEFLEQAAELLREDRRAAGAKGVDLARLGRTDEGRELLGLALESDVADPILCCEMAVLSESQGASEDACRYYRRGFELMIGEPRRSQ